MLTVLVTGSSSGFGLATVRLFSDREWDVVATARTPSDMPSLSDRVRVLPLDVTDAASIAAAIAMAGPIDALVNNAGFAFFNALEGTPIDMARLIFETNTLRTMAMTQAVVPQMREAGAGTIVNVSSAVTYSPDPLLSAYAASKSAVNGFSETVAIELEPFGIRVHVVVPGFAPLTNFNENAGRHMTPFPTPYQAMAQERMAAWQDYAGPATSADDVAEAVWRAVTDDGAPMYLPAGRNIPPIVDRRQSA